MSLEIGDGEMQAIRSVVNPEKLRHGAPARHWRSARGTRRIVAMTTVGHGDVAPATVGIRTLAATAIRAAGAQDHPEREERRDGA